ncbi:prolipoprotein diacylglyceryl transferase [Hydrogenibacillus schlegelii]|uniref:Phosphatidylglycerol--prolipoprotein diacylglyceryl transferase n=1 Tax=Hydrogenibacillus schlegelii TaxID=1484 RepID=A0A132NBC6_HYDSH|nr:prolipoprotein diacylglyceryl transferase [Hydrogenibacillus schlegelii]KWX07471.1 diacylglyceryl transferase [Hydrogenibacillus schlegelii]OAR03566.1 prolipoprotein diacylglyceryl transferase [Hydrogenibacillus schlegelii]PTQ54238.1 MAG: Prolipoprotein diacylglyceryl transferase [Hydrogenibacillus schlegelii]
MILSGAPFDPIAFRLGPLAVHWYGILIGIGALVGLFVAVREGRRFGVAEDFFYDLLLLGVPVAIVFARAYYVLFQWPYYAAHPEDIVAVWKGGLAIHGALIGSGLVALFYARRRRVSVWWLLDVAAPSLIIGQAIGRWGNFMNQEAHGGPVSRAFLESLHLPNWIIEQMNIGGTYHHPTFLYESIWDFLGFLLLITVRRRLSLLRGELIALYAIWYSVGRTYIEGMRTDSLMLTPTIRMAQVMGLLLIALGVAVIVFRRRQPDATRYDAPPDRPAPPDVC